MHLVALAYASQPLGRLGPVDLGNLLLQARLFNAKVQVTGVLLYQPEQFLQYIEGPESSMAQVFDRVQASRRHQDIAVLMRGPIEGRLFPDWQMGFAEAPASLLQRLSNLQWRIAMAVAEQRQPEAPALRLLREFWAGQGGGRPAA